MIAGNIIACDLDGTLIKINSYKHWLLFCCIMAAFTLNIRFLWLVISSIRARMNGSMDRFAMKRALIIAAAASKTLSWGSKVPFQWYLRRFVRDSVISTISRIGKADNCRIYLVTAAWRGYCEDFARHYDWAGVLATDTGDEYENLGSHKLENFLNEVGSIDRLTVLTDHRDDLPLASRADVLFLVAPSATSLQAFEESGLRFTLI